MVTFISITYQFDFYPGKHVGRKREIKAWVRKTLILTSVGGLIHWLTVEWHKKLKSSHHLWG